MSSLRGTDGLSSITSWIDGFGVWGAYPEPCIRNGGRYCQVAYVRSRSFHTLCPELHVTGATLAEITCYIQRRNILRRTASPMAWYVLSPLQPLWCSPTDLYLLLCKCCSACPACSCMVGRAWLCSHDLYELWLIISHTVTINSLIVVWLERSTYLRSQSQPLSIPLLRRALVGSYCRTRPVAILDCCRAFYQWSVLCRGTSVGLWHVLWGSVHWEWPGMQPSLHTHHHPHPHHWSHYVPLLRHHHHSTSNPSERPNMASPQ